jgi:uncharacterized protein with HEPN domain
MTKRDNIILTKIIEETVAVANILYEVDEQQFLLNDEKKRATCMTLINIGELIKNLNFDFRQKHSDIPWKDMAGLRDVAAHGYFTLRMTDIWIYASKEIPVLSDKIKGILISSNIVD